MTNNKRITYLDMARGMGMILVVMGHVEYMNMTLLQYIYAFHMPLFFLISGILIWEKREEEKNFIVLVKNKLRSIMLPYAVFSVLSLLIESARLLIKDLDEWNLIGRQIFQTLCLQGVSTLWFLPALFMSELLFIGIRKQLGHGGTVGATGIIMLLSAMLSIWEKNWYSQHMESLACGLVHDVLSMLLRNLFCAGFVCMGYYVGKVLLPGLTRVWQEAVGGFLFAVLAVAVISQNGIVELRYMSFSNLLLYLLGAIAGTMVVLCICRLLERLPWKIFKAPLIYFGRNSLIIMVTHMEFRVLYCSIRLASLIDSVWNNQAMFCVVVVLLVFLIEIPIIWFFNQMLPKILGKTIKNS